MSHRFEILFDPLPVRQAQTKRLDRVITPVDAFTGHVVSRGVTATIRAEERRARRSLSGHLVFEGLLAPAPTEIEVDAGPAGYFSPEPLVFDAPQDHDAPDADAERLLPLEMRPDRVIDGEAAVIRGAVRRGDIWVDGARIAGTVSGFGPPEDERRFETRTDERGSFALRLRPPEIDQSGGLVDTPHAFDVELTVSHDGDTEARTVAVRDLQTTTLGIVDLPET